MYSPEETADEATIVEERPLARQAYIVPRSYVCNDTVDEDSIAFPRNRFVEPHLRTLDHYGRIFEC